jgi:hypothetical protein
MSLSDYKEKKLLDHSNNVTAWTAPTTQYLALYKSDPGEANTGTEVSATVDDTAYARQTITFGAATSGAGSAATTDAQTFAAVVYGSGAAPYTVTHVGILDALTAGNLLDYAPLDASISRVVGKTLVFDIGAILSLLA